MSQQWFCELDGKIQGPFPLSVLREYEAAGRVQYATQVCEAGTDYWFEAGKIKGLFPDELSWSDIGDSDLFPTAFPQTAKTSGMMSFRPAKRPASMRMRPQATRSQVREQPLSRTRSSKTKPPVEHRGLGLEVLALICTVIAGSTLVYMLLIAGFDAPSPQDAQNESANHQAQLQRMEPLQRQAVQQNLGQQRLQQELQQQRLEEQRLQQQKLVQQQLEQERLKRDRQEQQKLSRIEFGRLSKDDGTPVILSKHLTAVGERYAGKRVKMLGVRYRGLTDTHLGSLPGITVSSNGLVSRTDRVELEKWCSFYVEDKEGELEEKLFAQKDKWVDLLLSLDNKARLNLVGVVIDLDNTTDYGIVVTDIEWFASLKEETVDDDAENKEAGDPAGM